MQSMTSTASSASAAARLAEARYHAKYDPAKVVVVADYRIPEPSGEQEAPEEAPREALDVEPVPRHPRPSSSWRNISRYVGIVSRFPHPRPQPPPPTPRDRRRCCFFLTRRVRPPPHVAFRARMRREVDKYRQTVDRPRTKETTHHEDLSASTAPGWPYTSGTVVGVPPPEWTRDDHFDHVVGGTDHGRRTKERAYQERHLARGAYLNASVVTGPAMLARVTREVDERFFPKKGTRPRRRGSGGRGGGRWRAPDEDGWNPVGRRTIEDTRAKLARPDTQQLRDGNEPWKWNLGIDRVVMNTGREAWRR